MNMNDMVAAMMDKDYTEDQIKSAVDAAIAKERIKRESEKTKAAANVDKLRHDAAIATIKYLHAALPNHFGDSEDSIKMCEDSLKVTEDEFRKQLEKSALESFKDLTNDDDDDDILNDFLRHLS